MANFLYFSDYIKPTLNKIRFAFIVIWRFLKILFRWRKGIRLLQLDYTKKYQFQNSYLIIHYKFKNALWYKFKHIKKTTERQIIIFSLNSIPEMPIELTVYGFFKSKTFNISVKPEFYLQSASFKTAISGFKGIELTDNSINICIAQPITRIPKIKLTHRHIQVKHPSYNQTNFI
jgi:hypothetical protein